MSESIEIPDEGIVSVSIGGSDKFDVDVFEAVEEMEKRIAPYRDNVESGEWLRGVVEYLQDIHSVKVSKRAALAFQNKMLEHYETILDSFTEPGSSSTTSDSTPGDSATSKSEAG